MCDLEQRPTVEVAATMGRSVGAVKMLRLRARLAEPSEARLVILERNGQISAIPLARKLQVVDVAVESDVQTVRLEFAGGA